MSWIVTYGFGGEDQNKPNNNIISVEFFDDGEGDINNPPIILQPVPE
jgi:hypothetical protein